jgi:hypothetical protein
MADVRTVTWVLRYPNGDPWEGGKVSFELIGEGYESGNGVQQPGYTVTSAGAAADGTDSIDLWQSEQSNEQAVYRVTLPSKETFVITVPDLDTDVDLSTLRAAGAATWSPGTQDVGALEVADYIVIGYQSGQDVVANPIAAAGATYSPALQIIGDSTGDLDSAGAFIRRTADAEGASLVFAKSRNATVGSFTVVQDDDEVGVIAWAADDGTDMGTVVAEIRATIDDASPASSSIGGDLVISTAAGASANDLTERVRISAAGVITIAGANGLDLNVGSDANTDIVTLSVTGTPRIWWDQSDLRFTLTHGLDIDAGALNASGGGSLTGTWSDLGTVTTVIINGGTIDGTVIGGNVAAAISGTTGTFSGVLSIDDTTQSTSTITGSIHTDGGLGVALNIVQGAGIHYINETSNANMTVGLTINQGAADNHILAFKSSDVATGLSTAPSAKAEADDFGVFTKVDAGGGGLLISSFGEDAAHTINMVLESWGGTASTTKTTAGRALVEVRVLEHNGADAASNITADGNVFAVRAFVGGGSVTRFLVDEDGDLYSVTAGQTFDDHDDLALVQHYDIVRRDALRSNFREYATEWENELVALGVLGAPIAQGGLTNVTQLQRLHNGAIRQLGSRTTQLADALREVLTLNPNLIGGERAAALLEA